MSINRIIIILSVFLLSMPNYSCRCSREKAPITNNIKAEITDVDSTENIKSDTIKESQVEEIDRMVDEINSSVLGKAYLWQDRSRDFEWSLSAENKRERILPHILDEFSIFKDSDKKVRKIIAIIDEKTSKIICYYDSEGYLIYCVFGLRGDTDIYSGYQYADKEGIILSEVKLHSDSYHTPKGEVVHTSVEHKTSGKPMEIESYELSFLSTIDAFSREYPVVSSFPDNTKKVAFTRAATEGNTLTNRNGISIRDGGSLQSKAIYTIDAGTDIKIISKHNEGNIPTLGLYNWYEVYYVPTGEGARGYIFGAFLEPVEKGVK